MDLNCMYEQESSLGYLVHKAARLMQKMMRHDLGPAPTPAYLPVILWLLEEDGQTQGELSRRARVEQPSMHETLHRMEKENLVLRRPDRNDKRKQRIFLTRKARHLSDKLLPWLDGNNRLMREGISNAEFAVFDRALRRMILNMDTYLDQKDLTASSE